MKIKQKGMRGPASKSGGFTLLELTVAMTVAAMVAAAVVSAFSTGLRAWERVQRETDSCLEGAAIVETMGADLRGAWMSPDGERGDFTLVPFGSAQGKRFGKKEKAAGSLSFTSLLSGREEPKVSYLADVSYRFEPASGTLWRKERPWAAEEEGQEEALAEKVRGFSVRCWDGNRWQEEWPAPLEEMEQEQPYLPQSVEITVELGGEGESRPRLRAVVPLEMAHP